MHACMHCMPAWVRNRQIDRQCAHGKLASVANMTMTRQQGVDGWMDVHNESE